MGFLTTITIRNDDLGQIEKHPDEFMKNLLQAINENEGGEIPCGYSCNAAIVQKSKHADDWAVYLHAGNTVTHMSSFSEESVKFARVNPKFYKEMVDYLYDQSKSLKAWFKRVF